MNNIFNISSNHGYKILYAKSCIMANMDNNDEVKPWDLLNPNEPRSDEETRAARLEICRGCEHFKKRFERCSLCGCFMDVKVLLGRASCPIGKW